MDRFILSGEHTVIDTETRLMWMRTDSMNDMEKWVNYQESVDYVRNLCESKIAGFSDWRLPSREEISTLFNESYSLKDKFEKNIHINDCFSPGAQFTHGRIYSPRWIVDLNRGGSRRPHYWCR